ncbi:MAG: NeuD/PglB/VioB family sugar acetyltransferase [Vicinamibacteria bacterium]
MSSRVALYVYGAGGHGKVVADAARTSGLYDVKGFLDDDRARWGTEWSGLAVRGGSEALVDLEEGARVAPAVGGNRARAALVARLVAAGRPLATVVHPTAVVATGVTIGEGTFVAPFAVLHADARVGRACIVNSAAVIEHDCVIEDYVHVSPRAVLGGGVSAGEGSHVALGALALPGLRVGAWTTLGAGAVMCESLPDRVTAVGVPARVRPSPADASSSRIYLSPPHVGREERQLVEEAFDSNWVAPLGPQVDAFESEFAAATRGGHAAALSSGTAALHLALRRLGIGRGDEVLCSTLTFVASANPIVYEGATPVFVDSDEDSWNMDPALLAAELDDAARRGRLPSAVVLVHLYGQSADVAPILEACDRHGVPLVEDAAEALGARYRGRSPGTFGRFGVFSFNGNKIITTSGGGMLVSPIETEIARVRFLASQAREATPHYEHRTTGFNYRLSNVLAAIGRGQLRHLPERVAARRRNFAFYEEALRGTPGLSFMPEAAYGSSSRWLSVMLIDPDEFGATALEIARHLERADIEARPVWKPMHLQPLFAGCRAVGGSVAESLFRRGLCLPSGSALDDAQRSRVVETLLGTPRSARRSQAAAGRRRA